MSTIIASLWSLLDTVFSFYIMLLLLRLLLQKLHANYYNPLCQFVIRITTPAVKALQHWLPTWRGIDFAVLVVVVALTVMKFIFMGWMLFSSSPRLSGIIVWCLGDLLQNVFHLFIYLIIGRVILSWIRNAQLAPVLEAIYKLTEPSLRPVRRLIPPIGGHDLSPLFLILALQLLVILIASPLEGYGQLLAFQIRPPASLG